MLRDGKGQAGWDFQKCFKTGKGKRAPPRLRFRTSMEIRKIFETGMG